MWDDAQFGQNPHDQPANAEIGDPGGEVAPGIEAPPDHLQDIRQPDPGGHDPQGEDEPTGDLFHHQAVHKRADEQADRGNTSHSDSS